MGVGEFLSEPFRKGYSDLIGINRAFFTQGLLLMSVCRRLPDPEPIHVNALKDVCNAVRVALREGAKKDVETVTEVRNEVGKKFEEAKKLLSAYLDRNGGNKTSLVQFRGSGNRLYDSKRLREEMVDAIAKDKAAMDALDAMNCSFSAKMKKINKLRKIGISINYFPDLGIPKLDLTNKHSPKFIIPDNYTAPIYYARNIFKVEERTTIEILLHRLLQQTAYDRNLNSLSLDRRPELYKRTPDNEHPVKSLLPMSTVDEYKGEDRALVLAIETELKNTFNVSNDIKISLPSEWRNIWIIKKEEWVMVRQRDVDFSLRKYSMTEFSELLEKHLGSTQHRIPSNASQHQHTSYLQNSYPCGQLTSPQPVIAPPTPFTPMPMLQPQHLVAPYVGQPPPTMNVGPPLLHRTPPPHLAPAAAALVAPSVGQPPPTPMSTRLAPPPQRVVASSVGKPAPTSSAGPAPPPQRVVAPSVGPPPPDTGPTRVNSAERAKMAIPDSSSATHYVAGNMRLVGREKKAAQPSGNFLSRLFKW